MDDNGVNRRSRGMGLKVALVGAGIAAGAIVATAMGANAANTTSGTGAAANGSTTSTTGTSATGNSSSTGRPDDARGDDHFDRGGPNPVRDDEKSVSASLAAKLKASALKAVPGGTVYRVETDAGDGTYEAHMTKADGTRVTVKFDKNGNVTKVEDGMGTGDPGHH